MKKWIGWLVFCCLASACNAPQQSDVSHSLVSDQASVSEPSQPTNERTVRLVGVGDNLIHNSIYEYADTLVDGPTDYTFDFLPIYQSVAPLIQNADLAFLNQETILGGDSLGLSGYPVFNSPSVLASQMAQLGFDLINGATNHSLDKGPTGVQNALQTWKEQDSVVFTGVFDSTEAQETVPLIERNGIKFAFLAYTYGTNGIEPDVAYRVNYFDAQQITRDVTKAKELADFVIVSAHWGDENTFAPNEMQQQYAQLFVDLEVDVVIGTHPHVIQPIEWVSNQHGHKTLIAYSLGNFLGGMLEVPNVLGYMLSLECVIDEQGNKSVTNVQAIPLVIHFEKTGADIMTTRTQYHIYPLAQYTAELASKHALNQYGGQTVSLAAFDDLVNRVLDSAFVPN